MNGLKLKCVKRPEENNVITVCHNLHDLRRFITAISDNKNVNNNNTIHSYHGNKSVFFFARQLFCQRMNISRCQILNKERMELKTTKVSTDLGLRLFNDENC